MNEQELILWAKTNWPSVIVGLTVAMAYLRLNKFVKRLDKLESKVRCAGVRCAGVRCAGVPGGMTVRRGPGHGVITREKMGVPLYVGVPVWAASATCVTWLFARELRDGGSMYAHSKLASDLHLFSLCAAGVGLTLQAGASVVRALMRSSD